MRNLRKVMVVGCLLSMASGCALIPGYSPSTTSKSSTGFFLGDIRDDGIPVAEPKVATAPEKAGLKIRKSERGNMESYVVRGQRYYTLDSAEGYSAKGVASWYGPNFHGRTASNGEVYDMYRLTAAHKTLPLPTYARVTHVENGKSVIVKINDRGPFSGDRIIDLSFAAALRLGMVNDGTGNVEIKALSAEEMLVLSGPDNSLDIDFHYLNEEGEEAEPAVIAAAAAPEEQLAVVAPADVDQNPITALPIVPGQSVTPRSPTAAPANTNAVRAGTNSVVAAADTELLTGFNVTEEAAVESLPAGIGELIPLADVTQQEAQDQQSDVESSPESLDGELQEALLPVVAEVNVQGLANVPAAVQTAPVPQPKPLDTGYFIQAGVYPDANDAERVAFDVVLAAPGEKVSVKPLKDSLMYRITVGPIVSSDHADKVAGLLTEAGLENFTVHVK